MDVVLGVGVDFIGVVIGMSLGIAVDVEDVGTPVAGAAAALWVGDDLTGLAGTGLVAEPILASLRLGITVNEFLDWRRKLARALACVSLSGMSARSGFGEGRISKSGEERSILDGLDSARAPRVSREHGTLGLGSAVLSQSCSLVGFVGRMSGSSFVGLPPSSKSWRKEYTAWVGVRLGLSGSGFGLEDPGPWKMGNNGSNLGFGTRSGFDQSLGRLLALQSKSRRFSVLWDFFCSFP